MVEFVYFITSLLFFDIPLLYYYNSSQIISIFVFVLFFGDLCLFLVTCNCLWILLLLLFWKFYDFFNIPLLYFNLSSSIIYCLSSGDTCFSLGISLSCSFVTVSELFCCEFFESFANLFAVLWPIKSPVASPVFWISCFEEVLSASVADF